MKIVEQFIDTKPKSSKKKIEFHIQTLTFLIGLIAFLLPIWVVLADRYMGCNSEFRQTISDYYHSSCANTFFVGSIISIAVCFFTYIGNELPEKILTKVLTIFSFVLVFFPTKHDTCSDFTCNFYQMNCEMVNNIHLIAASFVFLILGYLSLVEFPKDDKISIRRRITHRVFGSIIYIALILTTISLTIYKEIDIIPIFPDTFIFESVMLWAFSFSWFIKCGFFPWLFKNVSKNIT